MDLKDIKELISLMKEHDLSEFKLEEEGFKITLRRGGEAQPIITMSQPAILAPPSGSGALAGDLAAEAPPREKLREIPSPMVGTFYAAPSPEAPPYISPGKEVTEDTVVCIIEAMKVMNEIKAEVSGTIVEVVAESGKPVQYGQPLFRIR